MYLVRINNAKKIRELIDPFLSEIGWVILIEGGANRLAAPSNKSRDLIKAIDSWVVKTDNYKYGEFSNTVYWLKFDENLLQTLEMFSDDISKWKYPSLLEDMNFLRSNGHSLMYVNFLGNANFYLTESELNLLRKSIKVDDKNVISFSDFMTDSENQSDDSDSWEIISNYPKLD